MHDSVLENISTIEEINSDYLTSLLQQHGYEGVRVIDFTCEPVDGKSYGGGSIHRFKLTFSEPPFETVPHSLILKESREIDSQALDQGYARREAECYTHDLFQDINKRLYIPKSFRVSIQPEVGKYWIWMEDLGNHTFNVTWSLEEMGRMIRDISEFHAIWWERVDEIRNMPFLKHRAQAMYDGLWVDRIAQNCHAIETHPQTSLIGKIFTPERKKLLMRLSKAADMIYPKLEALPQTLLHHDIWPPNLGMFNGKTVLIDWSYVGQGTPGADLSQTVALLLQMWDANLDDEVLLQALWSGLREDFGLMIEYEEIKAGYELAFCLRPAHALGAPVLGSILSGNSGMVGSDELDGKLASADAVLQRIERGINRL